MLSIARTAAGALTLALFLTRAAAAAPPGMPPPMRGPVPPLERVLDALDLTASQRTAIGALLDAHHAALDAKREDARAAHEALHAAVVADDVDEDAIRSAAAAVAESDADRFVADAKLLHDVRALLDKKQRAQIAEELAKPPQPPFGGPPQRMN